jgi:hypothetical protein
MSRIRPKVGSLIDPFSKREPRAIKLPILQICYFTESNYALGCVHF